MPQNPTPAAAGDTNPTTPPMKPEQRKAIAVQIGEVKPATNALIGSFAESVANVRNHEHPTWEDLYCMNLTSYMGERMAPVLKRLLDAETEVAQLRARYDNLDKTLDEVMTERDAHHDALDQFALAVAPEEVIGEHSSGNNPWANAFELVTPAAEVDVLRTRVSELEQLLAASQSTAKQLLRKAASVPSQREAGAL